MALFTPRSLRAASVDCTGFSLARFERELRECIGEPERADLGTPGSGDIVLTDGSRKALTSYLMGEWLSKFDDKRSASEKEKSTWDRFQDAERLCFETNQRLSVSGFRGPYQSAIQRARNIADKILGRFDWNAAAEGFGWGPGASTRLTRTFSDAAYKYSGTPETTIGNAILAHAAICSVPSWKRELEDSPGDVGFCKIVPGNRIVSVPKNFKTNRTIAIEPCMNMYIQKGIGALMRKRLKTAGCDLDDQTRNQRLARIGSFSGRLATVDLSMASDTISRVLVEKFIRSDWLEGLEQTRSPFGVLPSGEKIFYQKFSSMGNGFTFELESLIFYSLALAWTIEHGEEVGRVSVYGDDIILPSAVADSFGGLLTFLGFRINEKKSYWTGPFRESCGKHYFLGHDVSPFYVRKPISSLPDLFLLHNNLKRWEERAKLVDQDIDLSSLLRQVKRFAPAKWRRARIPDGFGDGAFIGSFDEIHPVRHRDGWEFWVAKVIQPVTKAAYTDVPGLLPKGLSRLQKPPSCHPIVKGFPADFDGPYEVHPSWVTGYKEKQILIPLTAIR